MRWLPIAAATLVLAGCGLGGGNAEEVLAETAAKLGEIRSGTLDLGLTVTPREGEEFGFELRGPFELAEDEALPKLRIEYTQIVGEQRGTVTIVSTGEAAWAEADGERLELSAAQVEELRGAAASIGDDGDGLALPLDDWIENAEVSDGGELGGAETDRVEGELDVVATVNGLLALVRALGRDLRPIEGPQAERLRDATRDASFVLHTGKEDRLLRSLELNADFGLELPDVLGDALGDVGAKVTFRLAVDRPNEAVTIGNP